MAGPVGYGPFSGAASLQWPGLMDVVRRAFGRVHSFVTSSVALSIAATRIVALMSSPLRLLLPRYPRGFYVFYVPAERTSAVGQTIQRWLDDRESSH